MYKDSGNKSEFIDMYKGILRAGGSKRPKDLLADNGIDITSGEFYKKSFTVVEELINQTSICCKCNGDGWVYQSKGGQGGLTLECKKCSLN